MYHLYSSQLKICHDPQTLKSSTGYRYQVKKPETYNRAGESGHTYLSHIRYLMMVVITVNLKTFSFHIRFRRIEHSCPDLQCPHPNSCRLCIPYASISRTTTVLISEKTQRNENVIEV